MLWGGVEDRAGGLREADGGNCTGLGGCEDGGLVAIAVVAAVGVGGAGLVADAGAGAVAVAVVAP